MSIYLKYFPSIYPIQPFFRYCGAFQLSTIASAKGKVLNPFTIFTGRAGISGFVTPKQLFLQAKKVFGISNYYEGDYSLDDIKKYVDSNQSIILFIGHGYNNHLTGFNFLKAIFFQHYISIWGYDEYGFFVYDSSIKKSGSLPIGNCYINNSLLQSCRDWGGLFFYQRVFITIQ